MKKYQVLKDGIPMDSFNYHISRGLGWDNSIFDTKWEAELYAYAACCSLRIYDPTYFITHIDDFKLDESKFEKMQVKEIDSDNTFGTCIRVYFPPLDELPGNERYFMKKYKYDAENNYRISELMAIEIDEYMKHLKNKLDELGIEFENGYLSGFELWNACKYRVELGKNINFVKK